MKGYKFMQKDMKSRNGDYKWEIGKWYKEENIKLCEKGFHACKEPIETLDYLYGDKFFIVEGRGEIIEEKGKKFVASEMRLVKELDTSYIFKRFAIKCAKQCLSNYEKEYPTDKRVFEAIEGAELYLDEKIDLEELNKRISAARSAARSAESAAWSAAWSARSAAMSAAESAARSAAMSAARSAAWSSESAARSAAWSAWSARSAAESAARKEQNKFLKQIINEGLR
jgi:hypothetical protein